jgi:hypothetical protein
MGIAGLAAMLALAASGASGAPPEQALPATPAGLVAADSARFDAMVRRDIPALSDALADELVYVHSSSIRQSKAEQLRDLERGTAVYERIEARAQEPSIYGQTGLIQGVAAFTTAGVAGPSTFTLRYTDVYVLRAGRWQMVAWHCTRMPEGK